MKNTYGRFMKWPILAPLLLLAACGDSEVGVNPSDISTAGTALAILSSFEIDNEELDIPMSRYEGTYAGLWCRATLNLSGGIEGAYSIAERDRCTGSSEILTWSFWQDNVTVTSDLVSRPDGDLDPYSTRIVVLIQESGRVIRSVFNCQATLSENISYRDDDKVQRQFWSGSVECEGDGDTKILVEGQPEAEWDGEAIRLNGFEYETAWPSIPEE